MSARDDDTADMVRRLPWPFPGGRFPPELGAVVARTVISGELPAREVAHAPDGSWLVGDGVTDPNQPAAVVVTHMSHVVERNSSVAELAGLPPGHIANRLGPGRPWNVEILTGYEDDDPPPADGLSLT
ncbi:MAG TPA: hypothetical protein VML96_08755 [Egibacteraceae bacterium]|nr:hypothetical protein [Egibacteraceae bacterium]